MLAPHFWPSKIGDFKYSIYIYLFSSFISIISVDMYLGPETNAHLLAFLIFITALLTLGEENKRAIFIVFLLTILAFIAPTINSHSPFVSTLNLDQTKLKVIRFLLEITLFFLLIFKLYLLKILLDAETQKAHLKSEQASVELDNKQYLLKILSHDIKSPIGNSLRGIESLIAKNLDQKSELINIKNSQLAVKEMIDNISAYNFDMSSIKNISKDIVTLDEIFNRLRPLVESRLVGKNILLNIMDMDLLSTKIILNSDTFIYQILGNIISNSIKFSDENSTITIKIEKSNSHLVLSVQDHGAGIDPEALKNQKYTTKGTWGEKGSGVGMEIIQKFCELNEITVQFKSSKTHSEYLELGTLTQLQLPLLN